MSKSFSKISLLLSILFLSQNIFCQINVSDKPAWVVTPTFDNINEIDKEEVSDGYLYLIVDKQVEIEKREYFNKYTYEIFTVDGVQNASKINVDYDPVYQKLVFHELYIERNGEVINKLEVEQYQVVQRETNLDRHIYDGTETAFINLQDVRVGDKITYSYSLKGMNPIYEGHFSDYEKLQFYDFLPALHLRYNALKTRDLNIKLYDTEIKPIKEATNDYQHITIKEENIAGKNVESNVPNWYMPYSYFWISDFNSWEEVNTWATKVYDLNDVFNEKIKAEVEKIEAKDFLSQAQKIDRVITFVQDEIRYFGLESGIGSYQPHLPSKVLTQRFGDCKDKSLLLVSMLKLMDVEADPALVNSNYTKEIINWIPNQNAFDHCIVKINYEGKTFWIDPTINNQGGSIENIYCPNYGFALVLDGKSKTLEEIKSYTKDENKTIVNEKYIANDFDSSVSFVVRTEYYGRQADYQRSDFENNKRVTIQENYLNYYSKIFEYIELEEELKVIDNKVENIFTVEEKYNIDSFWVKVDNASLNQFDCEVSAYGISSFIETNIAASNRKMPYALYSPLNYTQKTILELPVGLGIEDEENNVFGEGFRFNRVVKQSNNTLHINYNYQTNKDYVEAGNLKAYASKQSEIYDLLTYSVTYTLFDETQSISTPVALISIVLLLACIYACFKIDRLYDPKPAISAHFGKKIGGWLYLFAAVAIFKPLNLLSNIFKGDYFDNQIWAYYAESSSIGYDLSFVVLFYTELAFNLISFVFCVYLAIVFFQRSSSAPGLIAYYFTFNVLFILGYYAVIILYYPDLFEESNYKDISNAFIGALIWVSYFNKSTRVEQTFVNRRNTALNNKSEETTTTVFTPREELYKN